MPGSETKIRVKVQPGASPNQILGFQNEALRVRVAAPPERGKANHALLELLAEATRVPKSSIRILSGHTSRDKWVAVDELSLEELHRRLGDEPWR